VRLLGQRVRVTLDYARNEPPVVSEGILLGFGDEGTVEVEEDDGFIHCCWPMLDVEPASGEQQPDPAGPIPVRPKVSRQAVGTDDLGQALAKLAAVRDWAERCGTPYELDGILNGTE